MYFGSITKVIAVSGLLLFAGCSSGPEAPRAIGEAYAGPVVLKLRREIPLDSPVVATVKHGDRLEIVGRRRRFYRVRAPSGAIGWTHERQLLASQDMDDLRELSKKAAKLPSQGTATTFADLNIHTLPARQAPSFSQIKENEKVEVLFHLAAPREDLPSRPLIPPPPKKASVPAKPKKPPKYPPPPMPPAPPPPDNWLELSKTDLDSTLEEPGEEEEPPKPVPTDDWTLVRTRTGQSGWALTRRLFMAIPDEVAQYAEGHRIVAYFPLGEVIDGDQKKKNWLWATIPSARQPYDFDSFRVFVWNLRRHRYETAYIERNVQGYLPILLGDVEYGGGAKAGASPAKYPGFSVCLEKEDVRRRREYAFLGNVVRFAGERACEPPPQIPVAPSSDSQIVATPAGEQQKPGLTERLTRRIKAWFGKPNAAAAR